MNPELAKLKRRIHRKHARAQRNFRTDMRAGESSWTAFRISTCWPGGTGACWNIGDALQGWDTEGEHTGDPIHICDLNEVISALTALRDSEAHKQNVKFWEASA